MNYLLDTHAFIWWDSQPEKLSPLVLEVLENTHNDLFISVVSLWEMQIKQQLGKLKLNKPLETLIAEQQDVNGFSLLPIRPAYIFTLSEDRPASCSNMGIWSWLGVSVFGRKTASW
ncbi:MAG: PilT protein-like protein [uncultured Thiotrichaceae bacterium]|uniref:PilT protein-like protein n=1 Tax=uncultured Thiotrichaceae bacterium TaxID=298394 RepID=A0A6S6UGP3_9GAMM|nr:MAG: PilT protein-like protein [uncultured Thiotrichaceae bacterium]